MAILPPQHHKRSFEKLQVQTPRSVFMYDYQRYKLCSATVAVLYQGNRTRLALSCISTYLVPRL